MDKTDYKILNLLVENSRISGADIARQVHLSLPAVSERLRKLNKLGVISSHTVKLNSDKLGLDLRAYVKVWLNHKLSSSALSRILQIEEVLECHHMAGDYDLLLKVLVKGTKDLDKMLTDKLKIIEGVERSSTMVVLDTYKEEINRKMNANDLP